MPSFFKKHFWFIVSRELFRWKLGSQRRKSLHVISISAKDLLETRMQELGSEHGRQPEVGQQTWSFQTNQPILNSIRQRSGDLISWCDGCTTWKNNVPISGDRCWFFFRRSPLFRANGAICYETHSGKPRSWDKFNPNTFIWRQNFSVESDLFSLMTWLMCRTVLKHVLFMKAKRSTLKMKCSVRKRKDPLLIMTRVNCQ